MADISIKDYLEKQNKQERLNIPVQDGGSNTHMEKIIDFLTEKIFEESEDAGAYMEKASQCSNTTIKNTLNKIAREELEHQKWLINLLADVAKMKSGET